MTIRYLTACLAALILGATPASARDLKVGDVAPDFTLTLMDGSTVHLSDLRGQVVVLNFWATWCAPCKKELPLLDSFYRYEKGHGVRIFAVTTQDSLPLFEMRKIFDLMAIPAVRHLKGPYSVLRGVPTNYIIGRNGRIRYAKAAMFDLDKIQSVVIPLVNEPDPTAPAT